MPEPVNRIVRLLGDRALLIPIPPRHKGPKRPWKDVPQTAMRNPAHIRQLSRGNIGVVMGKRSGGICSIDIDHDDEAQRFLDLNPDLAKSLRTKGARGENIWLQMLGPYPSLSAIRTTAAAPWGEWRSDGGQTVIYGIHPNGERYAFINEVKPSCVHFGEIVWPAHVTPPPSPGCTQETQEYISYSGDTDTHEVLLTKWFTSVEEIVAVSLPQQLKSNHSMLFKLARGVIALEHGRGSKFTTVELLDVFNQWHARATEFLSAEQTKEDYMTEFLDAYRRAKHPLGGVTVIEAWHRATSKPPPPEAMVFDSPDKRHLVALCRELQIAAGDKPFYLSCRVAQKLLKHQSHSTVAIWLGAFQTLKLLQEVEKGSANGRMASQYRYVPKI